jgi:hypothetical protein
MCEPCICGHSFDDHEQDAILHWNCAGDFGTCPCPEFMALDPCIYTGGDK